MNQYKDYRLAGIALLLTAGLLISGGIIVLQPGGGLANPAAPMLYYLGTLSAIFAALGLYSVQFRETGRLGLSGMVLTILGAALYSGPQLALIASTFGAAGWHDVWGFAMGNVLLVGPTAFFLGMVLLGIATQRSGVLSRGSGVTLAFGAGLWLAAYFLSVVPGLLTLASVVTGVGLAWAGLFIISRGRQASAQPVPAA